LQGEQKIAEFISQRDMIEVKQVLELGTVKRQVYEKHFDCG